jgi:4-aminobutyrate aminotransferase-like enzyme
MNDAQLIRRRERVLANHRYFFYDEPLHLVRGEGIWMWDSAGKRYLDCYNNVASVGHCHPRVVEALHRQAQTLNTHTRYLHENAVDLCERLGAKLPGELEVCMLVCTGTEANDLAVQIARAVTGNRGVVVNEASYHGNSALVSQLSLAVCPESLREDWVVGAEPPNVHRGPFRAGQHDGLGARYASLVGDAVDALEARGYGTAALLVDSIWDSNGTLIAPHDYLSRCAERVRAAGGLLIADEVQAGYCRTGSHWWGFEHYGVQPDIVTLGKPMGDGHPLAAVVMSRGIAERFLSTPYSTYFNTFGGNPVAAAVGCAVIDVIDDEGLLDSVTKAGAHLEKGLAELTQRHPAIDHVNGRGLFWGLDLVSDPDTREPLGGGAVRKLTSELAGEGVLMGSTGRYGNVLKIRPPLIFSTENADQALGAIDRVLCRHT